MDVIGAAKKISEAGANLDKFCRQVAEQVTGMASMFVFYFPLYLFIYCLFNINIISK